VKIGLGGVLGVGAGVKGACGRGLVNSQPGLEWREVLVIAQRATTPGKRFFHFYFTHVLSFIVYIVNMLLCYSYFQPLQVKNKPHDEVRKHAFVLEPISLVANNSGQDCILNMR
jgi:hypothetical protein